MEPIMKKKKPAKLPPSSPEPTQPVAVRQTPANRQLARAVIGPKIVIKAKVSGVQDLLINGRIEGHVSFPEHRITVGRKGRVQADILAKSVRIEGSVEGVVRGGSEILLCGTAKVRGKLVAPQIAMEQGCNFRGDVFTEDVESEP